MAEISEAAIEKLAKELAGQEGFEWQIEFKPPGPPGTKIDLKPILEEAGRDRYRARARQRLGRGNA